MSVRRHWHLTASTSRDNCWRFDGHASTRLCQESRPTDRQLPCPVCLQPCLVVVLGQLATNHWSPSNLACVCWCLWASTSTACISTPNMVRRDICWHNYPVERGLVVGFCGQPHYCYWPYYLTARFRSPLSYMVSDEPFPDRSRPMLC